MKCYMYIIPQRLQTSTNKIIKFDKKISHRRLYFNIFRLNRDFASVKLPNLQLSNSRELEVELYSGDEEDMKALGALIADKYGLISEDKSKYKRGLELLQQK